jgi:hypothetical protein
LGVVTVTRIDVLDAFGAGFFFEFFFVLRPTAAPARAISIGKGMIRNIGGFPLELDPYRAEAMSPSPCFAALVYRTIVPENSPASKECASYAEGASGAVAPKRASLRSRLD